MRDYLRGNKIVRNAGLGTLSLLSLLGLSGCVEGSYNQNTTNYNNRGEPARSEERIIEKEVVIIKEVVPYQGNRLWSEPTSTPPHERGNDPRIGNNNINQNWSSNQYWNRGNQNTWQYGQDHPRGQDPRFSR